MSRPDDVETYEQPPVIEDPCARCGHSAADHGGGPGEGEYPDLPCDCGCDRWTEEG